MKVLIKTLKYNNYYNLFTKLWKSYKCMDVQHAHVCTFVHMHACSHYTSMYACMLVACFYKMFPHTETYSEQQNKISVSISTEKKDLKQLTDIDHSFTFNTKVSNIGDDYLFK